MKKYLLFAYDLKNEDGGFTHFVDSFDTIEDVKETIKKVSKCNDEAQIVDRDTCKIIEIIRL